MCPSYLFSGVGTYAKCTYMALPKVKFCCKLQAIPQIRVARYPTWDECSKYIADFCIIQSARCIAIV